MINFIKVIKGFAVPILLGTMLQCKAQENNIEHTINVEIEQHYIPVVKGKYNDVISLKFELEREIELEEIKLSINGFDLLNAVQISEIKEEKDVKESRVLTNTDNIKRNSSLEINTNLTAGSHHLVLSIKPETDASLLEKVDIKVESLVFQGGNVIPISSEKFMPLRLATSLRTAGDDGVAAYRIPGLATTAKGSLLAVYDVRHNSSVDLQEDIDVGMSRSTDGGESWEPMQIIMDMGKWGGIPEDQNGIGDPAILVDPIDNTIYVMALWAHGKPGKRLWFSSQAGLSPEETGQLMLVKSKDDGKTWSEPISITSQIKEEKWKLMFNGPGKGITMRNGTLVFAGQYKDENDMPHSTIIYSEDKGDTWHIGTGAKSNTTEAQVVELNDGSLMLNMRDNRGGARSVAITNDLGKTWTEHVSSRSALPEPVCMGSLITYPENRLSEDASRLFFSNPAATDGRYNITVKHSEDQGNSWSEGLLLDAGRGWGYSCLTVIDEEHLGILYESSQAHMTFQIVPIKDIINVEHP
ncbi:sialidase family protein [Echinicola shivajiensis]|uniref:sialidase family protein n=1 Tax=Echinicola shivajiensis TaxID=1035916 RepID=UPI001FE3F74A|nr:sialidase family protein [Echinicola shivajiensis]